MIHSLPGSEQSISSHIETTETFNKPLLSAWIQKTSGSIRRLLVRNRDNTVRLKISDAIAMENQLGDNRWVLVKSGAVYTTVGERLLATSDSIKIILDSNAASVKSEEAAQ